MEDKAIAYQRRMDREYFAKSFEMNLHLPIRLRVAF
jgi:hypothetical protein